MRQWVNWRDWMRCAWVWVGCTATGINPRPLRRRPTARKVSVCRRPDLVVLAVKSFIRSWGRWFDLSTDAQDTTGSRTISPSTRATLRQQARSTILSGCRAWWRPYSDIPPWNTGVGHSVYRTHHQGRTPGKFAGLTSCRYTHMHYSMPFLR